LHFRGHNTTGREKIVAEGTWGVMSESGIFTPAPKGEEQARKWAEYKFKTVIGDVGETLHCQQ
jgi:hypothetical protein